MCDKSIFELLPHLLRIYFEKSVIRLLCHCLNRQFYMPLYCANVFNNVPQAFILASIYSSACFTCTQDDKKIIKSFAYQSFAFYKNAYLAGRGRLLNPSENDQTGAICPPLTSYASASAGEHVRTMLSNSTFQLLFQQMPFMTLLQCSLSRVWLPNNS